MFSLRLGFLLHTEAATRSLKTILQANYNLYALQDSLSSLDYQSKRDKTIISPLRNEQFRRYLTNFGPTN